MLPLSRVFSRRFLVEKISRFELTPNRLWIGVFALWLILLSGVFSSLGGSPGILQSLSLRSLLAFKQDELVRIEKSIEEVDAEIERLEKNTVTQEREVRRVLGYAAEDEIIFDFSLSQSAALRQ